MRCCKRCGCYLPDGVSECLACGYDEKRGYPIDEIPTTTLDENTLGFHYGYGLSQWNGEVRSPMGIVQAPVMPTKDEFSGYSWRSFDGKIWREYDGVVFPPPVTRKQ